MLALILRVVAFVLFLVGAFDGTLFGHGPLSLGLFGLAAWVLSTLLRGVGPPAPYDTREP